MIRVIFILFALCSLTFSGEYSSADQIKQVALGKKMEAKALVATEWKILRSYSAASCDQRCLQDFGTLHELMVQYDRAKNVEALDKIEVNKTYLERFVKQNFEAISQDEVKREALIKELTPLMASFISLNRDLVDIRMTYNRMGGANDPFPTTTFDPLSNCTEVEHFIPKDQPVKIVVYDKNGLEIHNVTLHNVGRVSIGKQ